MEKFAEEDRYLRAKKQVDKIKGFYIHLSVYILVNVFITSSKVISGLNSGNSFKDEFFEFGTFAVWIFWGIGIVFHALGVFGTNLFFGKNWEEKKMKEFIQEYKEEQDKWS